MCVLVMVCKQHVVSAVAAVKGPGTIRECLSNYSVCHCDSFSFSSPPPTHTHTVILVVSSTCKDPLEEFSQLYAKQKQSEQSKYPKWLLPHIYYYHVLLHDVMDGAAHLKRCVTCHMSHTYNNVAVTGRKRTLFHCKWASHNYL